MYKLFIHISFIFSCYCWDKFCRFRCRKFCKKFFLYFWINFWSIFPPNLDPTTQQNPLNIDAKRHSILDFKVWSILDRFWLPTCDPRTHKIIEILLVLKALFALRHFQDKIEFGFNFNPNLPSFPFLKSMKIHSKIDFQSRRCFDRFSHRILYRFGCNLEPSWASRWNHLGL